MLFILRTVRDSQPEIRKSSKGRNIIYNRMFPCCQIDQILWQEKNNLETKGQQSPLWCLPLNIFWRYLINPFAGNESIQDLGLGGWKQHNLLFMCTDHRNYIRLAVSLCGVSWTAPDSGDLFLCLCHFVPGDSCGITAVCWHLQKWSSPHKHQESMIRSWINVKRKAKENYEFHWEVLLAKM